MGYVNGARGDRLGFFLVDDLLAVAGAVKGISAIATSAAKAFGAGGKSTDNERMARAAFFGQSALAGSVTAGRYLLGGLQETGSHEQPYYRSWINALANDSQGVGSTVLAEASAQGPKWAVNVPDPGGTEQMFADVKKDLVALGKPAPPTSNATNMTMTPTTPTTRGVPQLPAMVSTAPFNWTPLLVAGGGLALAAAAAGGSRRRRRP